MKTNSHTNNLPREMKTDATDALNLNPTPPRPHGARRVLACALDAALLLPGQFEFTDVAAPGHPTRFYPLRSP